MSTRFHHAPAIWDSHPTLAVGVISAFGITPTSDVEARTIGYLDTARRRLDAGPVSEFPEIQAWRRAFASMGLKPTQYRCASEALLRRVHKEGSLPRIHPLVDLCNAISVRFATPIAIFDLAQVSGDLQVRPASGAERFVAFSGEIEHPEPGEVVFVDDAGQAHARRWTHRQSAASAIRPETRDVLIVAEALHPGAAADLRDVLATVTRELTEVWDVHPRSTLLTAQEPIFTIEV